jgi:hypothetical protein
MKVRYFSVNSNDPLSGMVVLGMDGSVSGENWY